MKCNFVFPNQYILGAKWKLSDTYLSVTHIGSIVMSYHRNIFKILHKILLKL